MLTGSGADTYNLYSITSASLVPEGQREVRFHEPSSRALTGWQRKVLQPARNARRVCHGGQLNVSFATYQSMGDDAHNALENDSQSLWKSIQGHGMVTQPSHTDRPTLP